MSVDVSLLGRFEVRLDGRPVPDSAWARRQAAALVKLLALSPRRQLHREQVIDALWPDHSVEEAGPRLHKAAYYARRVLGADGVVLRSDAVALFPDRDVNVDVDRFQELAAEALERGEAADAPRALEAYRGPLLPEDPYEPWAEAARARLAALRLRLLRQARRYADLVELDPTDGDAHLALMRQHAARGDRRSALRQFERLDRALHRELGLGPSDEAIALRDSLLAGGAGQHSPAGGAGQHSPAGGAGQHSTAVFAGSQPLGSGPTELIGRAAQTETLRRLLDETRHGRGRPAFVSGAPGTGKSTLLAWLRGQAAGRGWRTGHGVASTIEGAWPYAPVLEAMADLSRRHPTLLDGLDDRCRSDIDRALAGATLEWSGQGSHQRLFVAVAELVRLAAAGTGLLITVDDLHEADEASLRMLHYLARSCLTERLVLVLAHRRQPITDAFEAVRMSLLGRAAAIEVPLGPLSREETTRLAAACSPGLDAEAMDRIWAVSGGLPFAVVELARAGGAGQHSIAGGAGQHSIAGGAGARAGVTGARSDRPGDAILAMLAPAVRGVLEHVAMTGSTFDTDEFVALSGLPEHEAFDCLDSALAALAIERTRAGYRFRHPLIREALIDAIPPHRQRTLHRSCARRLAALDASPARVGHHLLSAGDRRAAIPYVLEAAETEAAVGAYRDALSLVDSVAPVARGADLARVACVRAELLGAIGDPAALTAYQQAIKLAPRDEQRVLRARMARMAVHSGDFDTASAALAGLETDGGPADASILLARGGLAYFSGDLDRALDAANEATLAVVADSWERLDLITLKGLITHNRGQWSQLLRMELQRTRDDPGLATALFDSHLCVAEYLLYGPTPYAEVIELATDLRATAVRAGARRAIAFAGALIGEAALLRGDLDLAERELGEAAALHREIGATAGEAHCLQRLAEVHLARGDRAGANRLLRRALPLARWSLVGPHLLQRLYGTMVVAAEDPQAARAVVDAAQATTADNDSCLFCDVMFAVPATIACAEVGDLAEARKHLAHAQRSAPLWEGTAWQAATLEAEAHLARAEGQPERARELLTRAAELFDAAAQPLDATRCRTP